MLCLYTFSVQYKIAPYCIGSFYENDKRKDEKD